MQGRSLEEQISNRCVHFTGLMNNDSCEAGIKYSDVRTGSLKFPCLKTGGQCEHARFPTNEEVKARIVEIHGSGLKALVAYCLIKDHIEKTNKQRDTIVCGCGGGLTYIASSVNGHVWARCKDCGISFNE